MRKIIVLLAAVLFSAAPLWAQDEQNVYNVVETMPSFPGGQQELLIFIAQHIQYPQAALESGTEGRPVYQFIVNRDGSLSDFKLMRSCGDSTLDQEALRVLSSMPRWEPGRQGADTVRVRYTIPVSFRITPAMTADMGEIYKQVDSMPEFPGGVERMNEFLRTNIKWPVIAQENNIRGTATCSFVVNKLGELKDPQIFRSAGDPSLDKEAMRIIRAMPRWKPGVKDGQPVRVEVVIPVPVPFNEGSIRTYTDSSVYVVVETMPSFPGGQQALFKFLSESVRYPEDARKEKAEGRVICQFVVERDGRITDVIVKRSSGNLSLDKEAVRVLRSMPRWRPGKQRGVSVRVRYTVPINFSLE